jgi:chromosome segregation ATPase
MTIPYFVRYRSRAGSAHGVDRIDTPDWASPSSHDRRRGERDLSAIVRLGRMLLVCAVVLHTGPARAQNAGETAAIGDFAREFKSLKEALAELPKKIEEANRLVEANVDPATAQKQLDALRSVVAQVLGLVADNGTVARLGQAALAAARGKLNEHRSGTQFTKEQREYLVREWQRVARETESAVTDLDAARKDVAELLRLIQSNEDFLKELQTLHQAHQTIEVIRNLTASLRDISVRLRDLVHNKMKVPSM